MSKKSGFTLSELLIAVAILGVIATFTISKVLVTVEEGKKRAIFKETIAAIQQAHWDVAQENGSLYDPAPVFAKLNLTKYCPTNASAEGCVNFTSVSNFEYSEPGGVMANGAAILGLSMLMPEWTPLLLIGTATKALI